MLTTEDHAKLFAPLTRPDRSGAPKYIRLTNALIDAISAGHWKVGDKLPTEEQLAELTPFSLGTVQRALKNLVDQGIVVRQHGTGSFVAQNDLLLEDPWHCRFLDDDGETLLPVFSKVLERKDETGRGPWSEHFPKAKNIVRIDRAINVNNEFTVFARFYLDSEKLTSLANAPLPDLNGLNFKTLIAQELHVPLTRITHDVRIETMESPLAEHINVQPGTIGLVMRAAAFMGDAACIYYQEFFIPNTQRRLSIPDQPPAVGRNLR
ncbi:GntR family transcriptional regulator [Caballeronia arvi]|uniref:GntR family transcriptional regulator n=1 Tax=Caballeronia arvi TaxID=1777135 RepID=UPI001F3562E8|nr:GntR family transcriptional regulator [Caballeronia arvi]